MMRKSCRKTIDIYLYMKVEKYKFMKWKQDYTKI